MHRFGTRLLLCLGLTLPLGAAQAADFNYDWLSAGIVQDDPSGGDSSHGWFVDGSYALSSQFTLQGSYYKYGLDTSDCLVPTFCELQSRHVSLGLLGAGWHLSVTDDTDLLLDAYLGRYQDRTQFTEEQFGVGTCPTGGGNVVIPGGCAQISSFDDSGSSYQVDAGVRVRCSCSLEFKAYVGGFETFRFVSFVSVEGDWNFAGPVALTLEARRLSSSDNQYRIGLRYLF